MVRLPTKNHLDLLRNRVAIEDIMYEQEMTCVGAQIVRNMTLSQL